MKPFSGIRPFACCCLCLFLWMLLFEGCRASGKADSSWVLAAGEVRISLWEYRDAYEMAKMAYAHNLLQREPGIGRRLHQRVQDEFSEALLLEAAAREGGYAVPEEALDEAVAAIRQGYPEDVFADMLAENAISERAWESALRRRLRMEKNAERVVDREIEVTPEALRLAFLDYCRSQDRMPEEVALTEALAEALVARVRKQEAGKIYDRWLQGMREKMGVQINVALLHDVFPDSRPLEAGTADTGGGEVKTRVPALDEDTHEEAGSIQ